MLLTSQYPEVRLANRYCHNPHFSYGSEELGRHRAIRNKACWVRHNVIMKNSMSFPFWIPLMKSTKEIRGMWKSRINWDFSVIFFTPRPEFQ